MRDGLAMHQSMTVKTASFVLAVSMGLIATEPPVPARVGSRVGLVDQACIRRAVESIALVVDREYFDPTLGAKVASALQKALIIGRYQGPLTAEAHAEVLTADMFALTHDRHLRVKATPEPTPNAASAGPSKPVALSKDDAREVVARRSNLGLQRVEILPGNIGYVQITAFYRPEEVREVFAAAMALLAGADALIIDLRENGGGSTGSVALLSSYLFDIPNLPLFEVVPRPGTRSTLFVTEATALVGRNGSRPVYALTSAHTFSGGEGLAFLLQEHRRAEVVGERTPGAGNQARPYAIEPGFEATIPNGYIRSSLRGGNWEGVGVIPDVPAPTADALRVAHSRALRALLGVTPAGSWRDVWAEIR